MLDVIYFIARWILGRMLLDHRQMLKTYLIDIGKREKKILKKITMRAEG